VRYKYAPAVQSYISPFGKNWYAVLFRKIIAEEKIMVPLKQVNAHSPLLKINQLFNDCLKLRIDVTIPAEPEIKQISQDKEIINMIPGKIQKTHDVVIAVIMPVLQMGVRQENRFRHPLTLFLRQKK
jgi:hypothetical protein